MNNISIQGNNLNIEVRNGQLYVNGKVHTDFQTMQGKEVYITVNGDSTSVKTGSGNITINGNVSETVQSGSGNINISKDVLNFVQSGSGNIFIKGSVKGSIKTGSGNVTHAS